MSAPALLNDFDRLSRQAANQLRSLAAAVEGIRPIETTTLSFSLSDLSHASRIEDLVSLVQTFALKGIPTIYIYRLAEEAAYPQLRDAFELRPDRRHHGVGKCYSRLSKEWPPQSIYVGSSWDLPSRTAQHLGKIISDGTYAMRLNLWSSCLQAPVDLTLCRFATEINPIELEALEQQIWDELKPMLGKRSAK